MPNFFQMITAVQRKTLSDEDIRTNQQFAKLFEDTVKVRCFNWQLFLHLYILVIFNTPVEVFVHILRLSKCLLSLLTYCEPSMLHMESNSPLTCSEQVRDFFTADCVPIHLFHLSDWRSVH